MSEFISFSENRRREEMSEFITHRYIEKLTLDIFDDMHPLSNHIEKVLELPKVGAHLKSTRLKNLYTHHGIYIGEGKVIHYAGMGDEIAGAPVEIVSLESFLSGYSYSIIPHKNATYIVSEVLERAYSRLGENDYSIVGNNCEHFVHWCIYGIHTSQQSGAAIKMGTHAILRVVGKNNVMTQVASATLYTSYHILAYAKNEISKEKFLEEIHHTGLTTLSTVYYSGLGQAMIPVPILGAVIGASVGFYVGNLLHRSGLIALGESNIVKIEKEKKERIEKMCTILVPLIEKHRQELKTYITRYFSDRVEIFDHAFDAIDEAMNQEDGEAFMEQLGRIHSQFNTGCYAPSFDDMVNAEHPPVF